MALCWYSREGGEGEVGEGEGSCDLILVLKLSVPMTVLPNLVLIKLLESIALGFHQVTIFQKCFSDQLPDATV